MDEIFFNHDLLDLANRLEGEQPQNRAVEILTWMVDQAEALVGITESDAASYMREVRMGDNESDDYERVENAVAYAVDSARAEALVGALKAALAAAERAAENV